MKLFDTLKNIWKIEELKTRILTTLGLILVYRLGTEVVLPGIDPAGLAALKQQTSSGVLGLLDMFSGGAFSNASIFALGIMPYISASIVVQLLGIAVPYFQRMQREGESDYPLSDHYHSDITRFCVSYQLACTDSARILSDKRGFLYNLFRNYPGCGLYVRFVVG